MTPLATTRQRIDTPRVVTDALVDQTTRRVREILIAQALDEQLVSPDVPEARRDEILRAVLGQALRDVPEAALLPLIELDALQAAVTQDLVGFGPITPLLVEPTVTEIIVRGTQPVMVASNGVVHDTSIRFRSEQQLMDLCQRIARNAGRKIDFAQPICSSWLPDGSRAQIVVPPIAIGGASLTIRKHDQTHRTLDDLVHLDSMPAHVADFLARCVRARVNIVVGGATDTGKTTLLRSLAMLIPPEEYLVTIEDIDELQLYRSHPHVQALVARPPMDVDSRRGEITHTALVASALRMRPTRIIVGEVRGPEALDFLQAASTGHDGSVCTLHAGSPDEALSSRLPTMCAEAGTIPFAAIPSQIHLAVELYVQLGHTLAGGKVATGVYEVLLDLTHPETYSLRVVWEIVDPDTLHPPQQRVARRLEATQ